MDPPRANVGLRSRPAFICERFRIMISTQMGSPMTNPAGSAGAGCVSWALFYGCTATASLIWSIDHDVFLRSFQPEKAVITVALMWFEIGALVAALTRRFLRKEHSLVLPIALACVALVVNLTLVFLMWPAVLFL